MGRRKTKNRKYISWKTKCAAALLDGMLVRERFGLYPRRWYDDAKKMTEHQFLSLFQFDHNILHETNHPDRDVYWNLTPMPIKAHREKTKRDAAIIAKSRRIRRACEDAPLGAGNQAMISMADAMSAGLREGVKTAMEHIARDPRSERYSEGWNRIFKKRQRKILSRGFDKTKRRKMSGKVVERVPDHD